MAPTRTRKQQRKIPVNTIWTREEDELLLRLAENQNTISWCHLAKYFPNKTPQQLASRWEKVLNPKLIKGSWTREEDEIIINYVNQKGDKDWAKLALMLHGRTGKQCRERFKNHLDTNVSHEPWTQSEDDRLVTLHKQYGNAWTKLAAFFPGRTDNCIKNRWNSTIKKRLERIERGEPLVLKRGRKPKAYSELPTPNIPDAPFSQTSPDCSSPDFRPKIGFQGVELMNFDQLAFIKPLNAPKRGPIYNVQQNREDLKKLLSNIQ